jgi:hypothetical protein
MKLTYTTKQKKQLEQVRCKWCDKFNKNKFKLKFYMIRNFWEKAPLPSVNHTNIAMSDSLNFLKITSRLFKWGKVIKGY